MSKDGTFPVRFTDDRKRKWRGRGVFSAPGTVTVYELKRVEPKKPAKPRAKEMKLTWT